MAQRIPNQFHFIFGLQKQKEPFHLMYYLCIESCFRVNEPDRIYFYYLHEPYGPYWELAKKRVRMVKVGLTGLVSGFRYGFKHSDCRKYRYAHHADFIRLEKLRDHGGVYADMDTIFVSKIPDHLFDSGFVLGRENDAYCQAMKRLQPSLCNAFIMSEQGSPFATLWLSEMERVFDGSWSNHSTLLPQRLSEKHPEMIHIEPPGSFYKHMWTREGIYALLQGCDRDFRGVISMHLWSHLWWSKRRCDFSDFHEGLLTEEYIRKVDTTYNIVARQYLP